MLLSPAIAAQIAKPMKAMRDQGFERHGLSQTCAEESTDDRADTECAEAEGRR